MGWIKEVPYPGTPHQCDLPNLIGSRGLPLWGAGSEWECKECDARFVVCQEDGCVYWAMKTPGGSSKAERDKGK